MTKLRARAKLIKNVSLQQIRERKARNITELHDYLVDEKTQRDQYVYNTCKKKDGMWAFKTEATSTRLFKMGKRNYNRCCKSIAKDSKRYCRSTAKVLYRK